MACRVIYCQIIVDESSLFSGGGGGGAPTGGFLEDANIESGLFKISPLHLQESNSSAQAAGEASQRGEEGGEAGSARCLAP